MNSATAWAMVETWWPIGAALVAVYILHVYRRARLSEPPSEAKGNLGSEALAWARLDFKRFVALVGGVIGGGVVAAKLAGFSVLGLLTLDPVVLADLAAVVLAALHLSGIKLPPIAWAGIIGGIFAVGLVLGDFWRRRGLEE